VIEDYGNPSSKTQEYGTQQRSLTEEV
jgi:hypothetical protein